MPNRFTLLFFIVLFSTPFLHAQPGLHLPALTEVTEGEEFALPVEVTNFNSILGVQFAIQWDPEVLEIIDITDINLDHALPNNFNWSTVYLEEEGILRFAWFDPFVAGISKPDGFSMFSVKFKAVGSANSSSMVNFINDVAVPLNISPLAIEIIDSDFSEYDSNSTVLSDGMVEINANQSGDNDITMVDSQDMVTSSADSKSGNRDMVSGSSDFRDLQVAPNPWMSQTTLSFELTDAARVDLTVLDAMGRTLYTKQVEGSEGQNRILLNREWSTTGSSVLYYRLETGNESLIRKMICIGG